MFALKTARYFVKELLEVLLGPIKTAVAVRHHTHDVLLVLAVVTLARGQIKGVAQVGKLVYVILVARQRNRSKTEVGFPISLHEEIYVQVKQAPQARCIRPPDQNDKAIATSQENWQTFKIDCDVLLIYAYFVQPKRRCPPMALAESFTPCGQRIPLHIWVVTPTMRNESVALSETTLF